MTKAPAVDWPAFMARRGALAKDARLRRFYAAWQLEAGQRLGDTPLVALDIETTGLDPNQHSIVSIGVVPFNLERIFFSQRRHWLVRPRFPLQALSVTLHHITHSDLEHAPDLGEVLDQVLEVLAGSIPVVHYRAVERYFIESAVQYRLGESLQFPMIDTMALEARFYRQSLPARLKRWLGGSPVSIRLQDSRARYGLPAYQPHHAALDALATAELFQAQVARRFSPDALLGEFWC